MIFNADESGNEGDVFDAVGIEAVREASESNTEGAGGGRGGRGGRAGAFDETEGRREFPLSINLSWNGGS